MDGLKDLSASLRGVFAMLLVVCATVLVGLDKLTGEQWLTFGEIIGVALIGGKTLTGVVDSFTSRPKAPAPAAPPPSSGPTVVVNNDAGGGS